MNISLIGYRGTGKTTIAEIIARRTGFALKSLDAMIVERAGMSIPEIVASSGWERFRDLETETLLEVVKEDRQVLDCGGGIILREQNRNALKKAGPVVWLTAAVPAIVERIKNDDQRPSLTGKSFLEEVEEVLKEREPLYRMTADYIVPTDTQSPEAAAEEILRLVR